MYSYHDVPVVPYDRTLSRTYSAGTAEHVGFFTDQADIACTRRASAVRCSASRTKGGLTAIPTKNRLRGGLRHLVRTFRRHRMVELTFLDGHFRDSNGCTMHLPRGVPCHIPGTHHVTRIISRSRGVTPLLEPQARTKTNDQQKVRIAGKHPQHEATRAATIRPLVAIEVPAKKRYTFFWLERSTK